MMESISDELLKGYEESKKEPSIQIKEEMNSVESSSGSGSEEFDCFGDVESIK